MTVEPGTVARTAKATLWTPAFALLCITVLLGYAHQAILTPTIPLFVSDKGGSALMAGLALLAFSVPSFLVRPYLGYLSDSWSAAGVLGFGLLLLAIGGILHITPFFAMIFVAGIIRGIGWAGLNTGGYTLLATVAPFARRGEASGYYSGITASAMVFFPAIALWLIDASSDGFVLVFILSSVIAAVGFPVAHFVSRALPVEEKTAPAAGAASTTGSSIASSILDRGVLLATGLNMSSTLATPAVAAFLPLYARELGIGSIGFFYVTSGITSILIRPLLGQRSDLIGRGPSIAVGLMAQLIGIGMIFVATGLPMILLGGVFTSLGSSLNGSATTALAMDLADPARRGKAMATFSISFQVGAGFGAIIAGALADSVGYRGMYAGSALIVACGLMLLLASWKSLPKPYATA